jgi:hypothetical protein
MVDIIHKIAIRAPLASGSEAVSTVDGVAGWWTSDTRGEARLGGRIGVEFRAPTGDKVGRMVFEPSERVAGRGRSLAPGSGAFAVTQVGQAAVEVSGGCSVAIDAERRAGVDGWAFGL